MLMIAFLTHNGGRWVKIPDPTQRVTGQKALAAGMLQDAGWLPISRNQTADNTGGRG